MISVVNRIETAARIKYTLDHEELVCERARTLQIDSEALGKAEAQDEAISMTGNGGAEEDDGGGPVKKRTKARSTRGAPLRAGRSRLELGAAAARRTGESPHAPGRVLL